MTITTTTAPSLASAMRDGSRTEHEAAEGSSFMAELLDGRLNERGYVDYLLRLRTAYEAMEDAVRATADDPMVAAVHDPSLERLAALDADLAYWTARTPGGADLGAPASPAAEAYADRLRAARRQAAEGWGGALVAHHYTRYLGDLSGGQAIGRILSRSFDLTDGGGVDFYAFPAIAKPKPYKDAYRARLDGLGLDEAGVRRVVEEVKVAFTLNQALFAELGRQLPAYRR
ncbi:biliverdin-producing heme oxygenase [Nocardioides dongxiaopingii]|uniref:biliverdin-producing heme oxygenase n=1 Tax=Nocardioides sp. S-1144 TaxID=2582905 RepID=UPI0011647BB1|nr:biliverdin-producing heme oxygenase [Nocardioides sp. S-1144]QCW50195.2 biliverdin-producing heme oxygenase [Nocardioides sp. S-1144]